MDKVTTVGIDLAKREFCVNFAPHGVGAVVRVALGRTVSSRPLPD
jgi:hypothetical protein